jgi:hypothetical protein
MMTLQQITTEEQFAKRVGHFLDECGEEEPADDQLILIVQGHVTPCTPAGLVECVRYSILNQLQLHNQISNYCIALVLQAGVVGGVTV